MLFNIVFTTLDRKVCEGGTVSVLSLYIGSLSQTLAISSCSIRIGWVYWTDRTIRSWSCQRHGQYALCYMYWITNAHVTFYHLKLSWRNKKKDSQNPVQVQKKIMHGNKFLLLRLKHTLPLPHLLVWGQGNALSLKTGFPWLLKTFQCSYQAISPAGKHPCRLHAKS